MWLDWMRKRVKLELLIYDENDVVTDKMRAAVEYGDIYAFLRINNVVSVLSSVVVHLDY